MTDPRQRSIDQATKRFVAAAAKLLDTSEGDGEAIGSGWVADLHTAIGTAVQKAQVFNEKAKGLNWEDYP